MKTLITLVFFVLSLNSYACQQDSSSLSIIDPADGSDFIISIKSYRPQKGQNPAVFILPPIHGETPLDRSLAKRFCRQGLASFILNVVRAQPEEKEIKDLGVHDHSYQRALAGVRAAISHLSQDTRLNGQFGILGMSLGGMLSAFVAGSEPRIKASVIIVGAGNVPGVLANSAQELVVKQRLERMKYFELHDTKTYEELLRSKLTLDPLLVAQNIAPGSSYLFIAKDDPVVPTVYQRQLAKEIRDPLVHEMRGDHFTGIIKAGTIHSKKIIRFFLRALKI
jgi:dienelactone hydrolase